MTCLLKIHRSCHTPHQHRCMYSKVRYMDYIYIVFFLITLSSQSNINSLIHYLAGCHLLIRSCNQSQTRQSNHWPSDHSTTWAQPKCNVFVQNWDSFFTHTHTHIFPKNISGYMHEGSQQRHRNPFREIRWETKSVNSSRIKKQEIKHEENAGEQENTTVTLTTWQLKNETT